MKAYLIHGFNVSDGGADTTDRLAPYLTARGFDVVELDYGYFLRGRVRLCNKAISMVLAKLVEPDSAIICHSNGAAVAYLAAKAGAPFKHVTLINPALNANLAIPGADSVHVWYSPSDWATKVAQFIPWSIWGAQGRTGYTGKDDPRYAQFNEDKVFNAKVGHSGIFSIEGGPDKVSEYAWVAMNGS